ncbi:hypothetical protein K491DRAFT_721405 [Lophiostoma macrostomum CBS 122681]|uniref:BTB domain-containing protein n=1 Tax=Lophiostoma macrostomum CBS 122681 TaxID=1314788 RepID=A0A6A6SQ13_9PLEO|nr:hypothetical protein K491DRAFT_721405 [Lophiostoma macrostomum CBS 122681]
MADLTIVYGQDKQRKFTGHRVILSNTSQWLANASKPPFAEADAKEIILHHDSPEGLEAMFEFSYCNTYTLPHSTPKTDTEHGDNFRHHIKVLIIADKYMADQLKAYALTEIQNYLNVDENNDTMEYLSLATVMVYKTPHAFDGVLYGANHDMSSSTAVGPAHEEPVNRTRAPWDLEQLLTLQRYEEEENFLKSGYAWNKTKYHGPPLDYLKHLVICFTIEMLERGVVGSVGYLMTRHPEFRRDLITVTSSRIFKRREQKTVRIMSIIRSERERWER